MVCTEKTSSLKQLIARLQSLASLEEKVDLLKIFVQEKGVESCLLEQMPSLYEKYLFLQVMAIDQVKKISFSSSEQFTHLLTQLRQIEKAYAIKGGILGYQCTVYELLFSDKKKEESSYYPVLGENLHEQEAEYVSIGWENLPKTGLLFPLGGAADRLNLVDPFTQKPLPAAAYPFMGHTLLENLMREVQGWEVYYEKHFYKPLHIPIGFMVSQEKENAEQVERILEEHNWFGKGKDSFFLVHQFSVPMVDENGNWEREESGGYLLKPGGHGMLWNLSLEQGLLHWFKKKNIERILVRQVNNPIAGVDSTLVAFLGSAFAKKKAMGFLSCPRRVKAAEGMNVVVEKKHKDGWEYAISSVEYCDLERAHIEDIAVEGSCYSAFSSNTNLFCLDLDVLIQAIPLNPFPGQIINLRPHPQKKGVWGRIECMMQNLADVFTKQSSSQLPAEKREENLETFLMHAKRHKTISTIKKCWVSGEDVLETAEGVFLDFLRNWKELLDLCKIGTVKKDLYSLENLQNPPFLFFYHPALGPSFTEIASKIKGGEWKEGAFVDIEIDSIFLENVDVQGSLHVEAKRSVEKEQFSSKAVLKNVSIANKGVNKERSLFIKKEMVHHEICKIEIEEGGEFYAENLVLEGNQHFFVPKNKRIEIRGTGGKEWIKREITFYSPNGV